MGKKVIAIVGMSGAGKTEVRDYLETKKFPFVRFGQITDEILQAKGLPLTQEYEKPEREALRAELGMAAYAIKSLPRIQKLLENTTTVIIDGLYSWEEYVYLLQQDFELILVVVYAEPQVRYRRLMTRPIRPLTKEEARERDIKELENLNKGGPIAIADYLIENNKDDLEDLYRKIDTLLDRLGLS